MQKSVILIPAGRIDQIIFLARGHRVMLDRDLAGLYGVEARVLNQAVRRNLERFPEDFLFSLTRPEVRNISQIVTCSTLKHARHVFAFTEQGVAMLSSVLNSPRAVQVNIEIMRAFVRLRAAMATNHELAQKLGELERKTSEEAERCQRSRSQFATLERGQNIKCLPYAFIEHGALMVAKVLNSPRAGPMSVYVIRAFVKMREDVAANVAILRRPAERDKTLLIQDVMLREILQKLHPMLDPPRSLPNPK